MHVQNHMNLRTWAKHGCSTAQRQHHKCLKFGRILLLYLLVALTVVNVFWKVKVTLRLNIACLFKYTIHAKQENLQSFKVLFCLKELWQFMN